MPTDAMTPSAPSLIGGLRRYDAVGNNPAKGIDRFPIQSRDLFIQPGEEFERVAKAFNNLKDEVLRDFFWMCLYTGARCGNVLKIRGHR